MAKKFIVDLNKDEKAEQVHSFIHSKSVGTSPP
jgi:hypothetical protein